MSEKVALVTGAARGIGLATTQLFIEQGWRVAMVDRDGDELHKAAAGLNQASAFVHDVSIPDQVDDMVQSVVTSFGRIDAVVNNAGVADFGQIEDTDFSRWRTVMATNLDGVFLVSQATIPALRQTRGALVNIASISGLRASTLRVAYGTSLVLPERIELSTSPLPRECSTPELRQQGHAGCANVRRRNGRGAVPNSCAPTCSAARRRSAPGARAVPTRPTGCPLPAIVPLVRMHPARINRDAVLVLPHSR
jgi:hypothetical protein